MNPGVAAVRSSDGVTHWAFFDPYVLRVLRDSVYDKHSSTALCMSLTAGLALGAVVTCIPCTANREDIREVVL